MLSKLVCWKKWWVCVLWHMHSKETGSLSLTELQVFSMWFAIHRWFPWRQTVTGQSWSKILADESGDSSVGCWGPLDHDIMSWTQQMKMDESKSTPAKIHKLRVKCFFSHSWVCFLVFASCMYNVMNYSVLVCHVEFWSSKNCRSEEWQQATVLGKPHKSRRLPISCSLWTWAQYDRNIHVRRDEHIEMMWWLWNDPVNKQYKNTAAKLINIKDVECSKVIFERRSDVRDFPLLNFVLFSCCAVYTSIYLPSLLTIFSAPLSTGTRATHSMAHALTCCARWHATSRPRRSSVS